MKKITSILLFVLIACCFVLSGCGETPLAMPKTNYVSSNGGFVVGVGDYVYFANAFNSHSNLTTKSDNDGEDVAQFAMKRSKIAELNEHNNIFNIIKNEEESLEYDNVVNKIAGYETSNIYVVGEYIYFTTPNIHKNKENKYEFNLSTLFRMKLNGTGLKEVCTTKAENSKFYLTGGNQQILIFDNSELSIVDAYKGSTSVKTIAKDIATLVFPKTLEKEIVNLYYTENKEEGETGNILKCVNIKTEEIKEHIGYIKNGETLNIIAYENDVLFYTRTGGDYDALYSNDFSNGLSSQRIQRYVTEGIDVSNFAYVLNQDNNTNCFVFAYGDKLYVQDLAVSNNDDVSNCTEITSEKASVKYVYNSYVIYTTEKGIYKYSVKDRTQSKQISDVENFNADYIDYDGKYVYFFAKAEGAETETKYLYRANSLSDSIETECIAELLEEDVADETEVEE